MQVGIYTLLVLSDCLYPSFSLSDGQKIAKKLSQQITKETLSMKCLLSDYNVLCATSMVYDSLTMAEVLSTGILEGRLNGLGTSCSTVASGSKREIIDAFLIMQRSQEELVMLQQESQNVVLYYQQRQGHINAKLYALSLFDDKFSRGTIAMLKTLLGNTTNYLKEEEQLFSSLCTNTAVSSEIDHDMYDSNDYYDTSEEEFV